MFGTDLDSVPAEIPYLGVPADVPNRMAIVRILAATGQRLRIGLVWSGNPGHKRDAERSMPPAFLRPLDRLQDVSWFCFQFELPEPPALRGMVPLGCLLSTFADTACALSGMDLVISVDTAVAHLAGALGIPVFLLLPFHPDFRWMLQRQDSPWYPTMRLYRQPVPGDWASSIANVLADLGGGQEGR